MNERNSAVCLSCGKPADMEITPTFRPLTAHGERAYEMIEKAIAAGLSRTEAACVDCLLRTGAAIDRGDLA